jgi:hypothetical protein
VAVSWVEAVMDRGDLLSAWKLTDPDLRLVLAQHWIMGQAGGEGATRDDIGPPEGWDELAVALAALPPTHRLWRRFALDRVARWREYWTGFSARTWFARTHPEVLRPDLEIVTFVEGGRLGGAQAPASPVAARRFALRHTPDGPLVAGVDGGNIFKPGWPPTQVRLAAG